MPIIIGVKTLDDTTQNPVEQVLGFQATAPAAPTAVPLIGSAPTVSSTPGAGQGVALTESGVLPPSAAATGLRMLSADPASPLVGEFWYRTDTNQFCVQVSGSVKRVTLA